MDIWSGFAQKVFHTWMFVHMPHIVRCLHTAHFPFLLLKRQFSEGLLFFFFLQNEMHQHNTPILHMLGRMRGSAFQ